MSPSSNRAPALALMAGVIGIGWSAIFVRWSGVSGIVSAFYRLAMAALVLVPWYLATSRGRLRPSGRAKRAAIVSGLLFAADLAFFNSAIMMTNAANATLLGVNAPIFVAIGTWLVDGERPNRQFWAGFGLALVGMIYIVGTDVVLHPTFGLGDVFAIAAAGFYGAYIFYVQRHRSGESAMDTLTFSAWSVTAGALGLLPICVVSRQPMIGMSVSEWGALVGLAVATQLVGHLLVTYALGHFPATVSSIALLAQAPLTAVFAWPALGERIGKTQAVGGVLVLAGICVVNLGRLAKNRVLTAPEETVSAA